MRKTGHTIFWPLRGEMKVSIPKSKKKFKNMLQWGNKENGLQYV